MVAKGPTPRFSAVRILASRLMLGSTLGHEPEIGVYIITGRVSLEFE